MQLSPNGRRLIQSFEGLSLTAYPDAAGYSIGYGHYGANKGDTITREEADRLFAQDAVKYEAAVSLTTPIATSDQFDAMTSLTYNIGTAGFAKSTVAKLHNMGDYQGAADAFRMWNKSQGKELAVLTNRREKERAIYLNGYGSPYSTPPQSPAPQAVPQAVPVAAAPWTQRIVGSLLAVGAYYLVQKKTKWLPARFRLPKGWPI